MYKQNIRVGIVTAADPNDKRSWSGTYFRMNNALKEEFSSVINLGPVKLSRFNRIFMNLQLKACEKYHKFFFNRGYNKNHSNIRSKYHAKFFDKKITQNKIDVIFAPSASVDIAHLKSKIPICYFADATISSISNYYDNYKKKSRKSFKISNRIEQKAISNSTTQVFPSQWAFDSAKQDYGATKTFLVKMGANIDKDPNEEDIIKHYDSVINILFVGVDWKRKGGDLVLETVDKLHKQGYNVDLTVVGCVPPKSHPRMNVIPFLNKNKRSDMLKFNELFKKSHLFFMPTRAEAFGIVFCEANAYGLPIITTDTGGVSSVIENGINGYMLPLSAESEDYFNLFVELISDQEKLKKMAKSSRQKYLNELNWNQWGKKMSEILLLTMDKTK